LALALALASLACSAAAAADPTFDYLYIVSNEGGSSGGHTAIRFDRDVYHFQNERGLLVLKRERTDEFFYSYALLGNRTIHSTRVAASPETILRLRERFRQRHRAQEAQIAVADALRADRLLLEEFEQDTPDPTSRLEMPILRVTGLGYFEGFGAASHRALDPANASGQATTIDAGSHALLALRNAILREYGPDFLSRRQRQVDRSIRALAERDPSDWSIETPTTAYAHPPFSRSYSDRFRSLAASDAALHVLEQALLLDEATYHAPIDVYFALTPEEIAAFERYAKELSARLVALANSKRADWGETLLIGMARLSALERSIENRRLVFLDSFPEESNLLGKRKVDRHRALSSEMLAENQRQLDLSRNYFGTSGDTSELAWERVEERSNRYFEMRRAFRDGVPMRLMRGHLIPSREGNYALLASSLRAPEFRQRDLEKARTREEQYSKDLRRLHRYGLIGRNCATALFETINDTFGDSIQLSQQQLGGYIGSKHSLSFIPFVSAHQVNSRYTVVAREEIPSYRLRRVRMMKDSEPSLLVALRESNTLTSQSYQAAPDDSFFVFFTDETPLLRPLFGTVNLTASLGQSVLGILTAPFDRGSTFLRGLRGTFVSLPELAFTNIRKGSNAWIPTEYRIVEPIAE
jgi:hypothetical protein